MILMLALGVKSWVPHKDCRSIQIWNYFSNYLNSNVLIWNQLIVSNQIIVSKSWILNFRMPWPGIEYFSKSCKIIFYLLSLSLFNVLDRIRQNICCIVYYQCPAQISSIIIIDITGVAMLSSTVGWQQLAQAASQPYQRGRRGSCPRQWHG